MAKLPYVEIILRRNFRTAKYPYGENSYGKFLYGEVSLRRNFLTWKFPTAKFSTAKFLMAKFPVTSYHNNFEVSCHWTHVNLLHRLLRLLLFKTYLHVPCVFFFHNGEKSFVMILILKFMKNSFGYSYSTT